MDKNQIKLEVEKQLKDNIQDDKDIKADKKSDEEKKIGKGGKK